MTAPPLPPKVGLPVAEGGDNPLLDEWLRHAPGGGGYNWLRSLSSVPNAKAASLIDRLGGSFQAREGFVNQYAWAVPDRAALVLIACYSPLIEVGAGTGYWANLLRRLGADLVAYDLDPGGMKGTNEWHRGHLYGTVEVGGPEKITDHPDRTLFLCWPPLGGQMVSDCLDLYQGESLLYVGEYGEAATGWDERLETEWEVLASREIPQWYGIHDALFMFARKDRAGRDSDGDLATGLAGGDRPAVVGGGVADTGQGSGGGRPAAGAGIDDAAAAPAE